MARAKNTDRADARRRHRAAMAAAEAAEASSDAEVAAAGVAAAAVPRDARASKAPTASSGPTERPGIMQAFRLAAAPADIRGDIRTMPATIRSAPLILLAPAAVLVGGVVLMVPALTSNNIGVLVAQLLVVPPPLIPSFLAGMLAPRASWLFGLLTGLFAGLLFAIYVVTASSSGAGAVPVADDVRAQALLYAVVVSPLFGLATGAFAGFYRRFLRISQPERQQRKQSKPQKTSAKSSK